MKNKCDKIIVTENTSVFGGKYGHISIMARLFKKRGYKVI